MKAMKRIEIIVDELDGDRVTGALERMKLGFTQIGNVSGSGRGGRRTGDDVAGALNNTYILTVCDPSEESAVIDMLRPLLTRSGGICIVSDCLFLR